MGVGNSYDGAKSKFCHSLMDCIASQFLQSSNNENAIKWCEYAILWEFEAFEDCENCIAMEQSGCISEWKNFTFCTHTLLCMNVEG